MDTPIKSTPIDHIQLHAVIKHAQLAMVAEEESAVNIMRADITRKEVYSYFLNNLPKTPTGNDYFHCSGCKKAIMSMGNWVVVNYDGSLDSLLFPALHVEQEFESDWTRFVAKMNDFVTRTLKMSEGEWVVGEPRRVIGSVTRQLVGDGLCEGTEPHMHFGTIVTPIQSEPFLIQRKADIRTMNKVRSLVSCKGLNSENIVGFMYLCEPDSALLEILDSMLEWYTVAKDMGETEAGVDNIVTMMAMHDERLLRVPDSLLDALTAFENTGDIEAVKKFIVKGI